MVEIPALLYQLDELLKKVDFVSVGSNDLFQYLFAVDRGNSKNPAVSTNCRYPCCAPYRTLPTPASRQSG
jgi:signal transduction protein with GAF and PtsI domain